MNFSQEADFQKRKSRCTFAGKIAFVINVVKSRKPYQFDILFEDPIIDFSKALKCQWKFDVETSNEYASVCFFLQDEGICDLEATIDMEIVDNSYNNVPTRYQKVMKLKDREERRIDLKNLGSSSEIKASISMNVRIAPQKATMVTQILEKKWQRKPV